MAFVGGILKHGGATATVARNGRGILPFLQRPLTSRLSTMMPSISERQLNCNVKHYSGKALIALDSSESKIDVLARVHIGRARGRGGVPVLLGRFLPRAYTTSFPSESSINEVEKSIGVFDEDDTPENFGGRKQFGSFKFSDPEGIVLEDAVLSGDGGEANEEYIEGTVDECDDEFEYVDILVEKSTVRPLYRALVNRHDSGKIIYLSMIHRILEQCEDSSDFQYAQLALQRYRFTLKSTNPATSGLILNAAERCGKLVEALEVFWQREKYGVFPSASDYKFIMTKFIAESSPEGYYHTIRAMEACRREDAFQPQADHYRLALRACLLDGRIEAWNVANRWMRYCPKETMDSFDNSIYSILIGGCMRHQYVSMAVSYRRRQKRHCSSETVNSIITAVRLSVVLGDVSKAWSLLEQVVMLDSVRISTIPGNLVSQMIDLSKGFCKWEKEACNVLKSLIENNVLLSKDVKDKLQDLEDNPTSMEDSSSKDLPPYVDLSASALEEMEREEAQLAEIMINEASTDAMKEEMAEL